MTRIADEQLRRILREQNQFVFALEYVNLSDLETLESLVLTRSSPSVRNFACLAAAENFRSLEIIDTGTTTSVLESINELTQLEHLVLSGVGINSNDRAYSPDGYLSNIIGMTWLIELDISKNTRIVNIERLSELVNLKTLRVNDCSVVDINPLAELVALETLRLDGNAVTDLSPLLELPNLISLDIRRTGLETIPEQLEIIEILRSRGCEVVYDDGRVLIAEPSIREALSLLGIEADDELYVCRTELESVTELNIKRRLDNSTGLEHFVNLEKLTIEIRRSSDVILSEVCLKSVYELPNLRELSVSFDSDRGRPVVRLYNFSMPNLERLYFKNVSVHPANILNGREIFDASLHPNLREIEVNHSGQNSANLIPRSYLMFQPVSVFGDFTTLEVLRLPNLQISDVSFITNLNSLRELDLSRNQIRDISPLEELANLRILNLSRNLFDLDNSATAESYERIISNVKANLVCNICLLPASICMCGEPDIICRICHRLADQCDRSGRCNHDIRCRRCSPPEYYDWRELEKCDACDLYCTKCRKVPELCGCLWSCSRCTSPPDDCRCLMNLLCPNCMVVVVKCKCNLSCKGCSDCENCGFVPIPCDCGDCEDCGFVPIPCDCGDCEDCGFVPMPCDCKNCSDCGYLGGVFGLGNARGILNTDGTPAAPDVQDAIQILRSLVDLPSIFDGSVPLQSGTLDDAIIAANITRRGNPDVSEPQVQDAIQILRSLVGLPNGIDDLTMFPVFAV
jgi:Leucine-rich repeat (LRR) protein